MPQDLTTEHQFFYQTEVPVTPKMLADSLIGLDGVVSSSASIIRRLLPDSPPISVEVLISSIELGSYKENFIVRMVLGEGKEAEEKIENIRKVLKLDKMNPKIIVGFAIVAAIMYAGYQYAHKDKSAVPTEATVHIENSFNVLGEQVGMDRKEVFELIESALTNKDKEELKKKVVKLVHPAGEKNTGKITLDNNPALTVPAAVIESIPPKYEKAEEEDPVDDVNNAQIVIRALDLDRPQTGWYAVIPDLSDKRIGIHVMPEVEVGKIPVGKYFHADVTVIYKVTKDGKFPKLYLLKKVCKEKDSAKLAAE